MRRHTNVLWGVLLVLVTLVIALNSFEIIPEGLFDLLRRAWPALLIVIGVALFLRNRIAFGSVLAVLLGVGLVAGVSIVAYSSRGSQQRDEQQVVIQQELGSDVTLLAVNISMLATDIEIEPHMGDENMIVGTFSGSEESEVDVVYTDREDGLAELTISEERPSQFPLLEAVGRGTLTLELPTEVGLALALRGDDGDATLNLSDVQLERLDVTTSGGNALVTLPAYEPRSPNADERPNTVTVNDGDVTLFVPNDVAARLELNRGGNDRRPQFDDAYILIDDGADGTLEKRNVAEDDIPLFFEVTAPSGLIRLEISGT